MAIPFRCSWSSSFHQALFSLFVKQLFDGLVIGEQVKLTLTRVVAETQLAVPIGLHSSRCAGRKRISFTRRSAVPVSPGLPAMALLSSAPSYITRLSPSPVKGNARRAATLDIHQECSRRPLHQRLLKSPNRFRHNLDINPYKTTHDVLEFAFAEIPCSPNASAMCSNQQPVPSSAGYSTG